MPSEKRQKQPRPIHWNNWPSGETACGKGTSRVRCTTSMSVWKSPLYAEGRRCPKCVASIGVDVEKTPKSVAP